MTQFRFSMIDSGIERVDYVEIPEEELIGTFPLFSPQYREVYRRNAIQKHLEKWALSQLNLSYEEVKEDGGTAGYDPTHGEQRSSQEAYGNAKEG